VTTLIIKCSELRPLAQKRRFSLSHPTYAESNYSVNSSYLWKRPYSIIMIMVLLDYSISGTMMDARRGRRSISTYLTDAIFIADTYALLFACSDRSLHLYDATGLVHVPLCHIIGMPNVPTCLEYHPTMNGKPGLLFLGDDSGNITMIKFHQAKNTLFKKKHPDKLDNFYWTVMDSSPSI